MASLLEQQRFRLDFGFAADDTTGLPDATIDALYVEAGETYTDSASIHAYTRVIYIGRLMIQAANEVDYVQNNTGEKASQRYAHLEKELAKWQGRLDDAVSAGRGSSVKSGRTTRKPARIKEYPGGGWSTWGWSMSDLLNWMQATRPTQAQRTARARRRAEHSLRRINDKEPVTSSIAFRTPAGVTLAAQEVRIELDNRASLDSSPAGTAPRMTAIIYGIRQHATLADTDMKEGYTFVLGNDLYRISDIIDTQGERQGIAVATG